MVNFLHFLAMGGYGFYVWSAYGLVFLVLLANVFIAYRHHYSVTQKTFSCRFLQKQTSDELSA